MRFLISGGTSAAFFFVLYYVALRLGLGPFSSNIAAYALAFVMGYTLQRTWTFGGQHSHRSALPRYFAVQAGCAICSGAFTRVVASLTHIDHLILSIVATLIASGVSFVASLLWVFPTTDPAPKD